MHSSAYHRVKKRGLMSLKSRDIQKAGVLEVAVNLLAPKRSLLHDAPRQPFAFNFQSSRVAMTAWPLFLPPVHVASSRPQRQDFFPAQCILGWPCFKKAANLLRKNAAAHHLAAPVRITSPRTNARHNPKNGQARRWPWEPPGSKVLFCLDLVSTTLRQ